MSVIKITMNNSLLFYFILHGWNKLSVVLWFTSSYKNFFNDDFRREKTVGDKSFSLFATYSYTMHERTARERRWSITRGNGGLARRNSIALEKQADPLVTNTTWLSTGAIRNVATKFGLCFLVFGAEGTGGNGRSFIRIWRRSPSKRPNARKGIVM